MSSVMDPSQPNLLEFSAAQERQSKYIRRAVEKLTKNNVLHNLFDADDLESVVWTKFYFKYLDPRAKNRYEYKGPMEERKFFKTIITRTYIDELRAKKHEIGKILSLETPTRDNPDFCLGDILQSIDSVLDEVMAKVTIGEAISKVVKESRTENMEQIAKHATGNGEKPTSDGYSKNYLNGLEKRLKDKVLETLLDAEKG